jgi:hypothetical protein
MLVHQDLTQLGLLFLIQLQSLREPTHIGVDDLCGGEV